MYANSVLKLEKGVLNFECTNRKRISGYIQYIHSFLWVTRYELHKNKRIWSSVITRRDQKWGLKINSEKPFA